MQYRFYAMVHQTLNAIDFAHSVGVDLFDVTNHENVLVNEDTLRLTIIDFGESVRASPVTRQDDIVAMITYFLEMWAGPDLHEAMHEVGMVSNDFQLQFIRDRLPSMEFGPLKSAVELMQTRLERALAEDPEVALPT